MKSVLRTRFMNGQAAAATFATSRHAIVGIEILSRLTIHVASHKVGCASTRVAPVVQRTNAAALCWTAIAYLILRRSILVMIVLKPVTEKRNAAIASVDPILFKLTELLGFMANLFI
ncbi:MAG: hypothetical protein ABIT04_09440 [Novosphingobium sp.]